MNKNFKVLLGVLFFLIFSYVGYKLYLLYEYKVTIFEYNAIKEVVEISDQSINIIINKDSNTSGEMVEFEDLIFKKPMGNFVYSEDASNNLYPRLYKAYYLDDENYPNMDVTFNVEIYNLYEKLIATDAEVFGLDFKNTNDEQLLKEFGINNDYDIYEYIINHYNDEVTIFSSENEIKLNYLIKMLSNRLYGNSKISLIDGDLSGIIQITDNEFIYRVGIVNGNTTYIFDFVNGSSSYFDLDNIKEFLSNINFKE
jgi:hypothetical protein